MEKVTTKQLPDEEVKNQVIKSLIKLRRKFGSAYELSQAVKKFGLFNGVVEYCEDGYDFRPFYDDELPMWELMQKKVGLFQLSDA